MTEFSISMPDKWRVSDDHLKGYLSTMTNRIANLCHHVKQAEAKNPGPKWLKQLPWNSTPGEVDAEVPGTAEESAKYIYGWDREFKKAWRAEQRAVKGKQAPKKDFCEKVELGESLDDMVKACWLDGHTWQVAGVTVGDLKSSERETQKKN